MKDIFCDIRSEIESYRLGRDDTSALVQNSNALLTVPSSICLTHYK